MHPLDEVRAKIARSLEHRHALQKAGAEYVSSSSALRTRWIAETHTRQFAVALEKPMPLAIRVMAGEVIGHLRSALDLLAWQLVLAGGGQPTRFTAFPIYETEAEWRKNGPTKLKGAPTDAVELIASVQPFTLERPRESAYHVLSRFANMDKHQGLPVVLSSAVGFAAANTIDARGVIMNPGLVSDDRVLAEAYFRDASGEAVDIQPSFELALALEMDDPEHPPNLDKVIHALGSSVTYVVNRCAKFFPPEATSEQPKVEKGSAS